MEELRSKLKEINSYLYEERESYLFKTINIITNFDSTVNSCELLPLQVPDLETKVFTENEYLKVSELFSKYGFTNMKTGYSEEEGCTILIFDYIK